MIHARQPQALICTTVTASIAALGATYSGAGHRVRASADRDSIFVELETVSDCLFFVQSAVSATKLVLE